MTAPFDLAAMKRKADRVKAADSVPQSVLSSEELDSYRVYKLASAPDQILALHAQLAAFRQWLVKERELAEQLQTLAVAYTSGRIDALASTLRLFDAAVSLGEHEEPKT